VTTNRLFLFENVKLVASGEFLKVDTARNPIQTEEARIAAAKKKVGRKGKAKAKAVQRYRVRY
jgi:hypothetical protein